MKASRIFERNMWYAEANAKWAPPGELKQLGVAFNDGVVWLFEKNGPNSEFKGSLEVGRGMKGIEIAGDIYEAAQESFENGLKCFREILASLQEDREISNSLNLQDKG